MWTLQGLGRLFWVMQQSCGQIKDDLLFFEEIFDSNK